ncbi:NADP-dependent malic enzyme [Candidatus Uhrbacteria bacterium]|nr:NADP-dependent malic enzyme [Candidatus Uhrbacteria bacterium]
MNIDQEALELHRQLKGKIEVCSKAPVKDRRDLSLLYTPGVGAVSLAIAKDPNLVWQMTGRGNAVAIVTDGSAVLGLGNIGPEAALPVMEGKALLFKEFGGVDAYPICLATHDTDEIVRIVKALAPSFGAVNLEDISAPRCFEIEERLQKELDIPVFHDDQHGTAIVVLSGLLNAVKLTGKKLTDLRIAISGAGAAGTATALLLKKGGVGDVVVVDSKGIVASDRANLSEAKKRLAAATNRDAISGDLFAAVLGRDVFVGLSAPGVLTAEMVKSMALDPIIFAMANPIPEIMPDVARIGGARLIATGRSDLPNQINNVLAFPGVFRGVLDGRIPRVTDEMKIAAAHAIAGCVQPTAEQFVPSVLDPTVAQAVAEAIRGSY